MSWESLDWRPLDAETLPGTTALADLVPLVRSALDEAASALVRQPVNATSLSVATVTAAGLPAGFTPAVSFELLGTPRRGVWVAVDPTSGDRLAGAQVVAGALATALVEALDAALVAVVGEGLSTGPADAIELDPGADLVLFRLALRDADGGEVALVVAVEAPVPAEFATHIVALQALGSTAASSGPAAAEPAAAEPAAAGPADGGAASPAGATTAPGGSTAGHSANAPASPSATALPQHGVDSTVRPYTPEELPSTPVAPVAQNIDLLMGVNLQVTVEIGRARLAIRDILALTPGSIVELDKLVGEQVDVLVNGQPIAQGEVVVVDENFGVRITDVVSRQRRILSADSAE